MIDVCVTHFGDKYSKKYLDNLEAGIARHYSGDFNFRVRTQCPYKHWDKISFFDCDKRTIVMDIDMVICKNLDELFNYPIDGFGAFKRWWRNNQDINGGFYILEPSENNYLTMDMFYFDPYGWIERYGQKVGRQWYGEQNFVDDHILEKTYLPNKWLGVWVDGVHHNGKRQSQKEFEQMYENQHKDKMLNNVKLLHFIYENKIEEHEQWIQTLWNGTSYA